MKRIYTFISLMIFTTYAVFAQLGYYYKGHFISLESKEDYVYLRLRDTLDNSNVNSNIVVRISTMEYLVKRDSRLIENAIYVSNIYKDNQERTITIMPTIDLKLSHDRAISYYVNGFGDELFVEEKDGDRYKIRCMVSSSERVLEIAAQIHEMEGVLWCDPDKIENIKPCNPLFGLQYYLINNGVGLDINVNSAWNVVTSNGNVTVAVIDSGVDNDHEDLLNSVLTGYTCGNSSGSGAPQNPNDELKKAHGIACAGIIAANDNTLGIKGVAPGVKILPVNIFPYSSAQHNPWGCASSSEIADAIRWAYARADILNCSWGGSYSDCIDEAIVDARNYGRNGKGCVVIAASGNGKGDGETDIQYPARLDGVIAVGAVDRTGVVTDYSQEGANLSLVAFGNSICTLDRMAPLGYYDDCDYWTSFTGTSAACPQVAGVAALMLSANPDLTESQVKSVLCSTASHIGSLVPNNTYGYGLVDAYEAVKEAIVHNAVFYAPTLLTGTNTYSISGLPTGATIVWSATSGMTISSVSTDTYSCTITCPSNPPSVFGVTAKVYYNGVEIKSFSKTVFTYFNGSYRQDACGYYGVNHPAISTRPLPTNTATYVHMGCDVHVLGGYCFQNATITHSGITPGSWYFNGNSQLTFSLPYGSSGMPFHIYINGDATTGTHLLFFPVSGNGNLTSSLQVQTSGTGYELTLIRQESEQWTGERGDMEWDVEVYDTLRGALMHRAHVKGDSYRLDTSAWRAGTYVVRAVTGDDEEPLVEKIQVK